MVSRCTGKALHREARSASVIYVPKWEEFVSSGGDACPEFGGASESIQAWWTRREGEREQGSTAETTRKSATKWLRNKELAESVRRLCVLTVADASS